MTNFFNSNFTGVNFAVVVSAESAYLRGTGQIKKTLRGTAQIKKVFRGTVQVKKSIRGTVQTIKATS